jgi:alkylation response protein AidB-like acyl-CoA dehydrogenase
VNLALSDEQELLREAARGSLARAGTVAAARAALERPDAAPDLWPLAVEAGWPGLLIAEERGGAGLSAFDAMLVAQECGRVLAGVPLLGLLPATALLDAAGHERLDAIAAGEVRGRVAAGAPARRRRRAGRLDGRARAADGPRLGAVRHARR